MRERPGVPAFGTHPSLLVGARPAGRDAGLGDEGVCGDARARWQFLHLAAIESAAYQCDNQVCFCRV